MDSIAKGRFEQNLAECEEALEIFRYLQNRQYKATFGLRFVWVAAVSALDHYVTELVIERATETLANDGVKTGALLSMVISVEAAMAVAAANPVESVVIFRKAIGDAVRFRSFQRSDDVAGGLALVWNERHKWQKIAGRMGNPARKVRETLNNIVDRRNTIAHNADYDDAANMRMPVDAKDAESVVSFLRSLVEAIDHVVQT